MVGSPSLSRIIVVAVVVVVVVVFVLVLLVKEEKGIFVLVIAATKHGLRCARDGHIYHDGSIITCSNACALVSTIAVFHRCAVFLVGKVDPDHIVVNGAVVKHCHYLSIRSGKLRYVTLRYVTLRSSNENVTVWHVMVWHGTVVCDMIR